LGTNSQITYGRSGPSTCVMCDLNAPLGALTWHRKWRNLTAHSGRAKRADEQLRNRRLLIS